MRAYLELTDSKSCMSRARVTEMTFVLLGRFEQIEQSLRSLPDVPPLADIVRTWRDTMELAALAPDAEKEG